MNDAVAFHLSPLASRSAGHLEFATFPRGPSARRSSLASAGHLEFATFPRGPSARRSSLASAGHLEFATFPRGEEPGHRVAVQSAEYLLARKLTARRINDADKGPTEAADLRNRLRVTGIVDIEGAIAGLGRFCPRSASDADRQRFFLRHSWPEGSPHEPPRYPR